MPKSLPEPRSVPCEHAQRPSALWLWVHVLNGYLGFPGQVDTPLRWGQGRGRGQGQGQGDACVLDE